jgi:nicotinamidase-related amidase
MPESRSNTPLAEDRSRGGMALVIVDMLGAWDFPGAEQLLPGAVRIAPRIAALKRRCKRAGVPAVYANDNFGRWRSDVRSLVDAGLRGAPKAAAIGEMLAPDVDDYFVLKPKHSAFYATPLDLLLRHLGATRLILCGTSSDQCILGTAADAGMRDYEIVVPADTVATMSAPRQTAALRYLREVLGARTPLSSRLRMP